MRDSNGSACQRALVVQVGYFRQQTEFLLEETILSVFSTIRHKCCSFLALPGSNLSSRPRFDRNYSGRVV
jgi:hypothetical protein